MPQIQPVTAKRVENVFKAQMTKSSNMTIKLAKENGILKSAQFSKSTIGNKDELVSVYFLGEHPNNNCRAILNVKDKIWEICEKAKEGAKLFADIMGWIK